jgi:hypothetical protein
MVKLVRSFDPAARAAEKQAMRDSDQIRLQSGEILVEALSRENDFFRDIEIEKFEIIAIGGKAIGRHE